LPGCASGDRPIPIKGTVTLDGSPVAGATVLFVPTDANRRPASGWTDTDGLFELTTFAQADGALPGAYRVVITKFEGKSAPKVEKDPNEYYGKKYKNSNRKSLLPEAYGDEAKTPLTCQVPPDQQPVALAMKSEAKP
jgi:hypothetical protein